jgi:glucosamine-6-phosphate deaminase
LYTQDKYDGEKMNIYIFENTEELYVKATEKMIDLIKNNPRARLGLATGSTPIKIYEKLIQKYQHNDISFAEVSTFNLDEYVGLEPSHPQSYAYFMNNQLFSKIDIKNENTHIPSGIASDIKKEIDRYDALLHKNRIDLQLLGIGTNGHIGFNEPGTSFNSRTHVITLDHQTRQDNARFFNSFDQVPEKAITMGISSIMQAKEIIMIATGASKAEAVKKMVKGPINPSLPASILQTHPRVHVFLDQLSAKEL